MKIDLSKILLPIAYTVWAFTIGAQSFGAEAGTVRVSVGSFRDTAYGVALQSDGKILVAGSTFNGRDSDALLMRFFHDGTLDTRFGKGGAIIVDGQKGDDKAFAVAVRWDDKIYLAGQIHNGVNTDFAIWRFTSTGELDKKFGRQGLARVDFGRGDDSALSIVLQTDGKAVVGGTALGEKDKDFALAKFLPDGAPDVGFGLNGKMITALGDIQNRPGDESGYSALVQPDGSIIQVGYSEVNNQAVMSMVRYLNDGRLDPTFAKQGSLFPYFPGKDMRAYASVIDRKGRILMAGSSASGGRKEFALLRILPDGKVDFNFGYGGIATVPLRGSQSTIYGIDVDSENKVIIAGTTGDGDKMNLVLARLSENGAVDPTFAEKGVSILKGSGKYDAAYSLLSQADGKVVTAGVVSEGNRYQVAMNRYRNDGSLDPHFGGAGRAIQSVDLSGPNNTLPKGFGIPPKSAVPAAIPAVGPANP